MNIINSKLIVNISLKSRIFLQILKIKYHIMIVTQNHEKNIRFLLIKDGIL